MNKMITKKSMKNILLLGLILFSIPSFAQKQPITVTGKEVKGTKINGNDTVITITRTDTIKTWYSPDIDEVKKETKQTLESYLKYFEKVDNLTSQVDKLNSTNANLTSDKARLTQTIKDLNQKNSQELTDKAAEKKEIQDIMALIIKQKSDQYSVQVAEIIKNRAKEHNIPTSDLEEYIRMNNIFVQAKELLTKAYNSENIDLVYSNFNVSINPKFSGLVEEQKGIKFLFANYESRCNALSELFTRFKEEKPLPEMITTKLKKHEYEYKEYPYLWDQIKLKLNTPSAPINIQCN